MFTGTVYSKYDRRPLAGIPVSDGLNITTTDQEGRFTLEGWERAHVLHVGVLTRGFDDWFLNIDGHEGDYDFFIDKVEVGSDFCFLHTSDTEIEGRRVIHWIDFLRDKVKEEKPAFFINTGDLARYDVPRHLLVMNSDVLNCPVRYTIGNHDFHGKEYGEQLYESIYGPTWYSFDCGDIHFIALSIGAGDKPSGYRWEDQWIWMQRDLARMDKSKKVIVLDHTHCPDETGFHPTIGEVSLDMKKEGVIAWVFGHYHSNFLNDYDGICNVCTARPDSGGIDSSEAGVRKLSISGHTFSSEMLYNMPAIPPCDEYVWQTALEGRVSYSTPLAVDGDILVGTFDDGFPKRCGVYRLDSETGAVRWYFATENGIKNNVAYEDGKVYVQDSKGWLYCLQGDNGSLLWKVKTPLTRAEFTMSDVLIVGDLLVTGKQRHVHAYNKQTGELVWEYAFPSAEPSPARFVYDKYRRQLIVSAQWRAMAALDIDTGECKWQITDKPLWFRTETPLVTENWIYACGLDDIAKVDPVKGEMVKVVNIGKRMDVSGAPVLDGDTLYYPSAATGVIAVDPESMECLRTFPTDNAVLFSSPYLFGEMQTVEGSPIIDGDELIFTASDGNLWIYDKHTAQVKRKIHLGAPSMVSPLVTDEALIVADFAGHITKFAR